MTLVRIVLWILLSSAVVTVSGEEWTIKQVELPSSLSPEAAKTARQLFGLAPGQRVDARVLDDGLRRLFRSGRFHPHSELFVRRVEGGVRVELDLEELPLVEMADIWGATTGPRRKAEALVQQWQGRGLYLPRLAHDERRLRSIYGLSAHPFAQIEVANETAFQSARKRRLGFKIDPGPASTFGPLRLEGIEQLDEAACRRAARLGGQPYHAPALQAALQRLQQLAVGQGFLDARVMLTDLYWDEPKRTIQVTFGLSEGKPYRVGSVEFAQTTLSAAELAKLTGLQQGEQLRRAHLAAAEQALAKHFADNEDQPTVRARFEFPSLQRAVANVHFEFQRDQ